MKTISCPQVYTCLINAVLSAHEVTLSAHFELYKERRGIAVNGQIEIVSSRRLTGEIIVVETQPRQVRQFSDGVWNRP